MIYREKEIELIKPMTYMNLSGLSLDSYIAKTGKEALDIVRIMLVIHDDLDLPSGKIRFKSNSSSGGHKGIESIIKVIGTSQFDRLKIGIGRPIRECEIEEYVLTEYSREEEEQLRETIENTVSAVEFYLEEGMAAAMSKFN